MSLDTATDLVQLLRRYRLLEPSQLDEVGRLQSQFPQPRALAKELLQRQWLTPFQVNQLFLGHDAELVLGPYILLERLSEGPLGRVYKARHQHMKRVAAVQVVREELLDHPEAVERFYLDLQAVSQLTHPHIVEAYDAGPVGRTHFFAMEYIEGADLEGLVKAKGPLLVDKARDVIRQAALGLQHAFERHLVHGDLKPGNLLLERMKDEGKKTVARPDSMPSFFMPQPSFVQRVKIRNLGLSLAQPPSPNGAAPENPVCPGEATSTADYQAPERELKGPPGDIRADLYSLGCVFYFLLTGQPPFPDGSPEDKKRRHREEEAKPVEALRAEVPSDVGAIVRRLMAKDPGQRFQTPAELAAALGPAKTEDALSPAYEPPPAAAAPVKAPKSDAVTVVDPPGTFTLLDPPPNPEKPSEITAYLGKRAPLPGDSATDSHRRRKQAERRRRRWLVGLGGLLLVGSVALFAWLLSRQLPPTTDKASSAATTSRFQASAFPESERFPWQPDELVAVFGRHRWRTWGPLQRVALSPDGTTAACGEGNLVRLYHLDTGNERAVLQGHTGAVVGLAFSPDGQTLATVSHDRTLKLWDWTTGSRVRRTVPGPIALPSAVAYAPNGQLLATGYQDGTLKVWETATGTERTTVKVHSGLVASVAFAPDGQTAVSASHDRTAKLWDVATAKERFALAGHQNSLHAAAFAPDGKTVATASEDKTVKLWNVATGKARGTLTGHAQGVSAVAFAPREATLASAGTDGKVKLWDLTANKEKAQLATESSNVVGLAYNPDGTRLLTGNLDGTLKLWDPATNAEVADSRDASRPVRCVAFSPDGWWVASGAEDKVVRLWDLATGSELFAFKGHAHQVWAVGFTSDGKTLASGSADGVVKLWDLTRRKERAQLQHGGRVHSIACAPDGKTLASAGSDNLIKLWDVATGKERITLKGHVNPVQGLAFAPDGKTLASASQDRSIKLWDVPSGKETATLLGHTNHVLGVSFTPDGQALLSAGQDGVVKLWDLTTQRERTFLTPTGSLPLSFAALSADGKSLIGGSSLGSINRWDVAAGKRTWERFLPGTVNGFALSADGRYLATANNNGTVYILRLP